MVTKRDVRDSLAVFSSVLAKIHMVTKLRFLPNGEGNSSVLAKIHMVTKH